MTARPFLLTPPEPKPAPGGEQGARRPRLRLTPLELPERTLQERVGEVLDALLRPPAFWFSAAIGATKLSPQQAAALSRAGVKRGLPDVMVIAPPHGRLYGIELKIHGGVLSKTKIVHTRKGSPRILVGQVERFAELEAAGMTIAVARSVDEVLAQLEQWQIPLRGSLSRGTVKSAPSTTPLAIE